MEANRKEAFSYLHFYPLLHNKGSQNLVTSTNKPLVHNSAIWVGMSWAVFLLVLARVTLAAAVSRWLSWLALAGLGCSHSHVWGISWDRCASVSVWSSKRPAHACSQRSSFKRAKARLQDPISLGLEITGSLLPNSVSQSKSRGSMGTRDGVETLLLMKAIAKSHCKGLVDTRGVAHWGHDSLNLPHSGRGQPDRYVGYIFLG